MRSKNKFIICLNTGLFLTGLLFAQSPVNFDFEGNTGAFFDDLATGSFAVDGLTLTASASSGTFNLTGDGFGINATGSGDDTDAIDAGSISGAESMVFSFDVAGAFNFIDFDRITPSGGDTLDLIFDGGPSFSLDANILDGADVFTFSESFTSGQNITLLWTGGNGFGLENINVTPIPEPSTYAMVLGFFVIGLVLGWKRFRPGA